jgi:hypothetical protein
MLYHYWYWNTFLIIHFFSQNARNIPQPILNHFYSVSNNIGHFIRKTEIHWMIFKFQLMESFSKPMDYFINIFLIHFSNRFLLNQRLIYQFRNSFVSLFNILKEIPMNISQSDQNLIISILQIVDCSSNFFFYWFCRIHYSKKTSFIDNLLPKNDSRDLFQVNYNSFNKYENNKDTFDFLFYRNDWNIIGNSPLQSMISINEHL